MEQTVKVSKREDYLSWDAAMMYTAGVMACRSKDPNTQVGCVIVDSIYRIIGVGYNGFPRGCDDNEFPWEREGPLDRTKYGYVVHAEQNAILNSIKDLDNAIMYVTRHPCHECAKFILQSGIRKVYYANNPAADTESVIAAQRMFRAAGIETVHYTQCAQLVLNV